MIGFVKSVESALVLDDVDKVDRSSLDPRLLDRGGRIVVERGVGSALSFFVTVAEVHSRRYRRAATADYTALYGADAAHPHAAAHRHTVANSSSDHYSIDDTTSTSNSDLTDGTHLAR